jgi:hypothetical protein
MNWKTKKGSFLTRGTAQKSYHFPAFTTHRKITSNFEVLPSGMSEESYKVIMGRDVTTDLGLIIDFKNGRILWDDLELSLNTKSTTPNESFEQTGSAVTSVESRVVRIFDAEYKKNDLQNSIPSHLESSQSATLKSLLSKYEDLFLGKLRTMPGLPYTIPLKHDAKPFATKPFSIPHIHVETVKKKKLRGCRRLESSHQMLIHHGPLHALSFQRKMAQLDS